MKNLTNAIYYHRIFRCLMVKNLTWELTPEKLTPSENEIFHEIVVKIDEKIASFYALPFYALSY